MREAGGRLRIPVQLVGTADGCQPWAGRWERGVDDAFAVQDELARLIVEGVREPLLDLTGTAERGMTFGSKPAE